MCRKTWSKASQAGLEKAESWKEFILASGTILVLICFPWLRHTGWNPYQSYQWLIPTAPNASKNNCSNTMQADLHREEELALSNTLPRLSLTSSQMCQKQLPQDFSQFWSWLKLSWYQKVATETSRNLSLEEVAWTKEWFDGKFNSSSETRPCVREFQVPLASGNGYPTVSHRCSVINLPDLNEENGI